MPLPPTRTAAREDLQRLLDQNRTAMSADVIRRVEELIESLKRPVPLKQFPRP